MITDSQIRAARGFLGWSQDTLADKSGVSLPTIKRMETNGTENSSYGNVRKVKEALEEGGVRFSEDGCVCPAKKK